MIIAAVGITCTVFGFAIGMVFTCSCVLKKQSQALDAEYLDIDETL